VIADVIVCQALDGRWHFGPAEQRGGMEGDDFGTYATAEEAGAAARARGLTVADDDAIDVDTPTLDAVRAPAPIDSADRRLIAWRLACNADTGCDNLVSAGDTVYAVDLHPRRQKNGALIGRVHAQRRGEPFRDIGAYKIAANGDVLAIPSEIADVLPGTAGAGTYAEPVEEAAS
jgi:hypothetical protein